MTTVDLGVVVTEGLTGPAPAGPTEGTLSPGRVGILRPAGAAFLLGWTLLIAAEVTGASRHFSHDAVLDGSLPLAAGLPLFLLGWLAMVTAMMLPVTFSVLRQVPQSDGRTEWSLGGLFVSGFILVWTVGGIGALGFDAFVHGAVEGIPWLAAHPSLVGAGLLLAAGVLQLAPSTRRHLRTATGARPPHGRGPGSAVTAGWHHGVHSLRVDGPLMLVMFGAGTSLAAIVVITAIMSAKRSSRVGNPVVLTSGVLLVAAAAAMALDPGSLRWLLGATDRLAACTNPQKENL